MDIDVSSDVSRDQWDALVREDGSASFFQSWDWCDLLTRTLPTYRSANLFCRVGGRLVALLPALRRTRLGVSSLESMAFGTFGGPVVGPDAPSEARSALLQAFAERARTPSVAVAQVVDRYNSVRPGDLPGFTRVDFTVQEVPLDAPYEELFARFKRSARNKIRKALKAGVGIRRAAGEEDFVSYYNVFQQCSRDWDVRPSPGRSFFVELSRLDPSSVQMWLATYQGDVIAGDLNFVMHGNIMNWGNVSTAAARELAPNNLLHANAIEQGALSGYHTYDLGASTGLEGVRAFKASFGARERTVSRYTMEKPWRGSLRRILRSRQRSEGE
ncbi:MAG: GNAT family N-acetyltransferase [Candidatus Eisenbacteria bacterium]|nr:GNAT family N-acetyltransferase [Candidatus Eisenbacteria bacterium]